MKKIELNENFNDKDVENITNEIFRQMLIFGCAKIKLNNTTKYLLFEPKQ